MKTNVIIAVLFYLAVSSLVTIQNLVERRSMLKGAWAKLVRNIVINAVLDGLRWFPTFVFSVYFIAGNFGYFWKNIKADYFSKSVKTNDEL